MGIDENARTGLSPDVPAQRHAAGGAQRDRRMDKVANNPTLVTERENARRALVAAWALALVVGACYARSLFSGFVNWDDPGYLTCNEQVRSLGPLNVLRMFTSAVPGQGSYVPLTVLSFAIEYATVGFTPWVYHLNNVLLHIVVVLLVFRLGRRLGLEVGGAFAAALLFGLHPTHVQSVAWVTERKDVLCGVFYVAAMIAYWRYLAERRRGPLLAAYGFGVLALLAKSMGVSLPLALLCLDWFKGRARTWQLIWDKVPVFVAAFLVSIACFVMDYFAGALGEHASSGGSAGLGFDPLLGFWCVQWHVVKFLLPVNLSPHYPPPSVNGLANPAMAVAPFFVAGLLGCTYAFRRRSRWPFFAVLFYVCTIAPVARFFRVGAYYVANHYLYLPSIGFCLVFGLLFQHVWMRGGPYRRWAVAVCGLLFLGCGLATYQQIGIWRDSTTLWENVLAVTHSETYGNVAAHYNLGHAYQQESRWDEAIEQYEQALEITPDERLVLVYLAFAKARVRAPTLTGEQPDDQLDFDDPHVQLRIGKAFIEVGLLEDAVQRFRVALRTDPGFAEARTELADLLVRMNRPAEAVPQYEALLRADPNDYQANNNLGVALRALGEDAEAVDHFRKALEINPDYDAARKNLEQIAGDKKGDAS